MSPTHGASSDIQKGTVGWGLEGDPVEVCLLGMFKAGAYCFFNPFIAPLPPRDVCGTSQHPLMQFLKNPQEEKTSEDI